MFVELFFKKLIGILQLNKFNINFVNLTNKQYVIFHFLDLMILQHSPQIRHRSISLIFITVQSIYKSLFTIYILNNISSWSERAECDKRSLHFLPRSFGDQVNWWKLSSPSSSFCSSFCLCFSHNSNFLLVLPSFTLLLWILEGMFISFTSNCYGFCKVLDIISALLFLSTIFTSAPCTTPSKLMINQIIFPILHKFHLWFSPCTNETSLMPILFPLLFLLVCS